MNRFELASLARNTITKKQQIALDSYLTQFGRDVFNAYRVQVDIRPGTPNARLTARQAWRLLNLLRQQEAGQ